MTYTHRSSFLHTLRLLQADVMAISGADSVLVVVPMFHANAWGLPFAVPAAGGKLVLPGRQADGASLARLIASEEVTIAVGVPTVWLGLVEHLEATGGQVPSLKRIIMGGAPLPPALMERIERRLGVTIQTSWGMTELSPSGTVSLPNDPARSAALSGRPAIGVDLLLVDADGVALPQQRGPEGHLRVRGAAVVERYFGQEDSATDADGWFGTGDLARIDADGNLIITGRAKDLIKSGGEWINPAEIEAVVGALPEVSLAAVIGRQDDKWGERPILLVEMRDHQADQRRGIARAAEGPGRALVDPRCDRALATHASGIHGQDRQDTVEIGIWQRLSQGQPAGRTPAQDRKTLIARRRQTPPAFHQGGTTRRDDGTDSRRGRISLLETWPVRRDLEGRREKRGCPPHAAQLLFRRQEDRCSTPCSPGARS